MPEKKKRGDWERKDVVEARPTTGLDEPDAFGIIPRFASSPFSQR
jgi:hypothetical protein